MQRRPGAEESQFRLGLVLISKAVPRDAGRILLLQKVRERDASENWVRHMLTAVERTTDDTIDSNIPI